MKLDNNLEPLTDSLARFYRSFTEVVRVKEELGTAALVEAGLQFEAVVNCRPGTFLSLSPRIPEEVTVAHRVEPDNGFQLVEGDEVKFDAENPLKIVKVLGMVSAGGGNSIELSTAADEGGWICNVSASRH